MEQNLQNQILGSINFEAIKNNKLLKPETVSNFLHFKEKPKRKSTKEATNIVRSSVKGRTKKISQEQGFRQYLQYTDPLLLNNNELDQSDLANNLTNILNVFAPKNMETEKMKEVQKFVATEIPEDVNEIQVVADKKLSLKAAQKRFNDNEVEIVNNLYAEIAQKKQIKKKALDDQNEKENKKIEKENKKIEKENKKIQDTENKKRLFKSVAKEAAQDGLNLMEDKSSKKIQNAFKQYQLKKQAKQEFFNVLMEDKIRNNKGVMKERSASAAEYRITKMKNINEAASTIQAAIRRIKPNEKEAASKIQAFIRRKTPREKIINARRNLDGSIDGRTLGNNAGKKKKDNVPSSSDLSKASTKKK